jgi:threonylcarbamoyladenosine tRNA methylthiotransferase MtaB
LSYQSKKTVAVCNMGCKVNSYESQGMTEILEQAGYRIVEFSEKADVYLINTCTVTQIAARKSRQMIHRARKMNPNALVIAAGCYVDRDDSLIQEGVIDIAIPNRYKGDLLSYINAYEKGQTAFKRYRTGVLSVHGSSGRSLEARLLAQIRH